MKMGKIVLLGAVSAAFVIWLWFEGGLWRIASYCLLVFYFLIPAIVSAARRCKNEADIRTMQ